MNHIQETAELLSRFPSIGKKTALRLVYYLLKEPKEFSQLLAHNLQELHERIAPCDTCGNLTDINPCAICNNPKRDQSLLCVVSYTQDIHALEESQSFNGIYHVLGGVISPLDGIGPEALSIDRLQQRIATGQFSEVILATSPSIEGESTAQYILKICRDEECVFSRIAQGMPMGGDFEYIDKFTIALSLNSRKNLV